GLTAGPVPPRVDGPVKAGLLKLVDHAVEAGWSARRACSLLGLDPDRVGGGVRGPVPIGWRICPAAVARCAACSRWSGP
ncbi:MAG: hypothetical protein M3513_12535, partial [Actinomycetota bacterium]|nr:hypothetical protein [Actinomycetota bacterium]